MIWIILTSVFGWLLCGAWTIRMIEKADNELAKGDIKLFLAAYMLGPAILIFAWGTIWPSRLHQFGKGIKTAWKQALKQKE